MSRQLRRRTRPLAWCHFALGLCSLPGMMGQCRLRWLRALADLCRARSFEEPTSETQRSLEASLRLSDLHSRLRDWRPLWF